MMCNKMTKFGDNLKDVNLMHLILPKPKKLDMLEFATDVTCFHL